VSPGKKNQGCADSKQKPNVSRSGWGETGASGTNGNLRTGENRKKKQKNVHIPHKEAKNKLKRRRSNLPKNSPSGPEEGAF